MLSEVFFICISQRTAPAWTVPVIRGHTKKTPKSRFSRPFLLNAGKMYCRMLSWSILWEHSTVFLNCIKLPHGFKTFVLFIFEWLPMVSLYCYVYKDCTASTVYLIYHANKLRSSQGVFVPLFPCAAPTPLATCMSDRWTSINKGIAGLNSKYAKACEKGRRKVTSESFK